jgi:ribosomal protein S18 acetylase RimI-like enzyme
MIFRKSDRRDTEFIIETIVFAEKSGTDHIGYCTTFDISEAEFVDFLRYALEDEIEGQEFCTDHFMIAEEEGVRAGACAAWVEGAAGNSANMLKAYLFMEHFGQEKMDAAAGRMKGFASFQFEREPGTIQIESVYVADAFRGRGLTGDLIRAHFEDLCSRYPSVSKAQVSTSMNNTSAIRAYEKVGFVITDRKKLIDESLKKTLPFDERCLLEMNINRAK